MLNQTPTIFVRLANPETWKKRLATSGPEAKPANACTKTVPKRCERDENNRFAMISGTAGHLKPDFPQNPSILLQPFAAAAWLIQAVGSQVAR